MNITKSDYISIIKENAVTSISLENIKRTDQLADIGIDSLGFATLLWSMEDRFNVQIDEKCFETLNGISTIADLINVFLEIDLFIDFDT